MSDPVLQLWHGTLCLPRVAPEFTVRLVDGCTESGTGASYAGSCRRQSSHGLAIILVASVCRLMFAGRSGTLGMLTTVISVVRFPGPSCAQGSGDSPVS